jgi:inorganic triphosphatase YgiF
MKRPPRKNGEVELKFELDRRAAGKIRGHELLAEGDPETRAQSSVYFDSDDGEVRKAGYSLRVRRIGDEFTQTVKTGASGAGLFDRGEWEAPVGRLEPDLDALARTPLGKPGGKLEPVVRSDVERTTWLIERDGSKIEAALDSGIVSAGDLEAPFDEFELELKGGDPAALFALAQVLGQSVPLRIGVLSKQQRGLMLADGAFEHEQKAAAPLIDKSMDAGQALETIVSECIRHFRLNEPLVIAEHDPEALHQARVALRRLRTGFALFGPVIRKASVEPLRTELREFIIPLGQARNLDVILEDRGEALGWRDRRKLSSARAGFYDEIAGRLNSQRARDMFLDLVEWSASATWRKQGADTPIRRFAAGRLDSIWAKVRRRGKRLGDLDEHQLHRFRIAVKKLRYAVGFLAPLYDGKQTRKFASSLEKMQDCLGLIHDDLVARQIAADFELGEPFRTDIAARSRQIKSMEKRFRKLKRVGRFWDR